MRKLLITTTVLLLAVHAGACGYVFYDFLLPGYGAVLDQREASNGTFRIRVQMRPALYGFMQYYHVFQSAHGNSILWREVVAELSNEPKPIPDNQLRLLSDSVGYFFTGNSCAVTADGGRTWSVFRLSNSMFNRQNPEAYIRDVQLGLDGSGTMMFAWTERKLYTKDFGKHWLP